MSCGPKGSEESSILQCSIVWATEGTIWASGKKRKILFGMQRGCGVVDSADDRDWCRDYVRPRDRRSSGGICAI